MADRKDFFDTPFGNLVATIVWGVGHALPFLFFDVVGGVIHFFSRHKR